MICRECCREMDETEIFCPHCSEPALEAEAVIGRISFSPVRSFAYWINLVRNQVIDSNHFQKRIVWLEKYVSIKYDQILAQSDQNRPDIGEIIGEIAEQLDYFLQIMRIAQDVISSDEVERLDELRIECDRIIQNLGLIANRIEDDQAEECATFISLIG